MCSKLNTRATVSLFYIIYISIWYTVVLVLFLLAANWSELKHVKLFFQLVEQRKRQSSEAVEAVREEPWSPSLTRTRLWTGRRPGREDLVGALFREFKGPMEALI